jgi:hypothetical protein
MKSYTFNVKNPDRTIVIEAPNLNVALYELEKQLSPK